MTEQSEPPSVRLVSRLCDWDQTNQEPTSSSYRVEYVQHRPIQGRDFLIRQTSEAPEGNRGLTVVAILAQTQKSALHLPRDPRPIARYPTETTQEDSTRIDLIPLSMVLIAAPGFSSSG